MRILQSKAACVLCAAALAAIPSLTKAATFTPLGFLVTDNTDPNFATRQSVAEGISADGTTVTGWSTASSNSSDQNYSSHEGFIWTSSNGMQPMGGIPGSPTPFTSEGTGVNSDGTQISGYGSASDPNFGTATRGFRYTNQGQGTFTDLGALGTVFIQTNALAMSGDGNTVVGESTDNNFNQRAFFYRDADTPKMTELPGFGQSTQLHAGVAYGVSADGSEIVGREIYHGSDHEGATEGALWVVDSGGNILTTTPVELREFLNYPASQHYETVANGISSDGTAAVGYAASTVQSSTNITQAVEWAIHPNGGSTTADYPVGLGFIDGLTNTTSLSSVANATSKDGSIVVGQGLTVKHTGTAHEEAFIYLPTLGMLDLMDYLTSLNPSLATSLSGWTLTDATGISSDGLTIIGEGTHPDPSNPKQFISEAFLLTIPEPTCLPVIGLAGLAALRRRKSPVIA